MPPEPANQAAPMTPPATSPSTPSPMRRADPLALFDTLQEGVARIFGWPFTPRHMLHGMRGSPTDTAAVWSPSLDMYEQGNRLVIKADLPGVKKEELSLTLEQGDLVLRGQRAAEREVREENYYRVERSMGSFYRRIPLPADVDASAIEASFRDGVLEVQVPLSPQRQTEVKSIPLQ